jgi:FkbM family methyltransferase
VSRSPVAAGVSLGRNWRAVLWLPLRIPLQLVSGDRFILLTPGWMVRQRVYDRRRRRLETLVIRDAVDRAVLVQVLAAEDYGLDRFAQSDALRSCYAETIRTGLQPLIVDAGAHTGIAARYFATEYPEAAVLAIEPDPANVAAARVNLAGHDNVTVVRAALSSRCGSGTVLDRGRGSWGYQVEHAGEGDVPLVTMTSLIEDARSAGQVPFIVKIDIEGSESEVFSADTTWIADVPLIIIELHDWLFPGEASSRNFLAAISRHDRDCVYRGENLFSFRNAGACGNSSDSNNSAGSN